jgi:hypothetical protein
VRNDADINRTRCFKLKMLKSVRQNLQFRLEPAASNLMKYIIVSAIFKEHLFVCRIHFFYIIYTGLHIFCFETCLYSFLGIIKLKNMYSVFQRCPPGFYADLHLTANQQRMQAGRTRELIDRISQMEPSRDGSHPRMVPIPWSKFRFQGEKANLRNLSVHLFSVAAISRTGKRNSRKHQKRGFSNIAGNLIEIWASAGRTSLAC